jgi:hypothetical protein
VTHHPSPVPLDGSGSLALTGRGERRRESVLGRLAFPPLERGERRRELTLGVVVRERFRGTVSPSKGRPQVPAALPLLALTFTELLAVLVINVYVVELALGIDGLGWLSYQAILARDLPLVIGTSMVVVLVAIAGNFAQDVMALSLDPRTGD